MATHVPREEWERRIRAMFAKRRDMIGAGTEDGGAANRADEVEIAMALWTFDENARGTEPGDILSGAGMVLAGLVRNLLEPWEALGPEQYAIAYSTVMNGYGFVMDNYETLQKDHVTATVDG